MLSPLAFQPKPGMQKEPSEGCDAFKQNATSCHLKAKMAYGGPKLVQIEYAQWLMVACAFVPIQVLYSCTKDLVSGMDLIFVIQMQLQCFWFSLGAFEACSLNEIWHEMSMLTHL